MRRVAFTDDFEADAARRDFTINAMSCDRDGRLFDYFGGRADLAAGRVRFVGPAAARIAEDFLRILRFFRFLAHYGRLPADAEALQACAAAAPAIAQLSGERVQAEMRKLLAATDPLPALGLMAETGVLAQVVPGAPDAESPGAAAGAGAAGRLAAAPGRPAARADECCGRSGVALAPVEPRCGQAVGADRRPAAAACARFRPRAARRCIGSARSATPTSCTSPPPRIPPTMPAQHSPRRWPKARAGSRKRCRSPATTSWRSACRRGLRSAGCWPRSRTGGSRRISGPTTPPASPQARTVLRDLGHADAPPSP